MPIIMGKSKVQCANQLAAWKWVIISGFFIFILALFLRVYKITAIPVFADEAIYIRWAQVMRAVPELRFLPLSDGKQPLFMWSVIPFFKVFSDPLVAGRMVSAFSGLAAVAGIFLLTHRLFASKQAALIASLLYVVSPFTVFFDRMALVDGMLNSLGIWVLFFGVLTAQTVRLDAAMFTGFALGAAWLTKSPAVFFLMMLPLTLLSFDWGQRGRLIQVLKLCGLWLVSWFIALAMYNIQRLGPNFHMIALRNKDYVFSLTEVLQHPLDPFQFHVREVGEWLWVLLPGTILLAAIFAAITGLRKFWREFLLLFIWVAFPLLVMSEFAKVFTARYILFAIPPLFILASSFFIIIQHKIFRNFSWLILLFFIVPALWVNYLLLIKPQEAPLPRSERSGYLEEWTAGTGIKEIADYLKRESGGIVVGTEGYFGTLPDGLQIYLNDRRDITIKGVGITISDVNSSLIEAKKAGNKVYLVVNSTRFKGDADNLGLKLINSYDKAQRPDGSRESLLFFEVTENAILQTNTAAAKKAS